MKDFKSVLLAIVIVIFLAGAVIGFITASREDTPDSSSSDSSSQYDSTSVSDSSSQDDSSAVTEPTSSVPDITTTESSEETTTTTPPVTSETTPPTEATTPPSVTTVTTPPTDTSTETTTTPVTPPESEVTTTPPESDVTTDGSTTIPTVITAPEDDEIKIIIPPYENDPHFAIRPNESYILNNSDSGLAELISMLREDVLEQKEILSLSGYAVTQDKLTELITLLSCENPDLICLGSTYEASINKATNQVISLSPEYIMDKWEFADKLTQMENRMNEIIAHISPDMSEFEVILLFHDEIIKNCRYEDSEYAATAYGALVDGRAICEGYAKAFKLLCDRVGIQTILITGYGNNQNHMWNMVNAGGKWYHMDLTWDDPTAANRADDYVRYDYFMLSEAEIKKDHTVIDPLPFGIARPTANSTEMNYFVRSGLLASSYEQATEILKSEIARAVSENSTYARVRLATSTLYNSTVNRLFSGEKEIFALLKEVSEKTGLEFNTNKYSQSRSDLFWTITVYVSKE